MNFNFVPDTVQMSSIDILDWFIGMILITLHFIRRSATACALPWASSTPRPTL